MVRGDSECWISGGTLPERTQRLRVSCVFVDPPMSALFSFLFSLPFLLGVPVLCLPNSGINLVSGGCYINIAGRKPISSGNSILYNWIDKLINKQNDHGNRETRPESKKLRTAFTKPCGYILVSSNS